MYDYQKAIKSGASEDQILQYLNQTRGYNVDGALKAGATKSQLIDYLSKTDKPNHPVAEPAKPNVFQRIGTTIQNSANQVYDAISGQGNYAGKPTSNRAIGAVLGGFSALPGVATDILPEPLRKGTEAVGKFAGETINNVANNLGRNPFGGPVKPLIESPQFQNFANSKSGQATADLAQRLSDTGQIAGDILFADQGAKGLQKGADITGKTLSTVKNAVVKTPEQIQANLESQAIKDTTPAYNKKLIKEPAINGTPRIVEGGIKGRTVTSTPLEIQAGQTLAKVQDYPANGTNLEKYQSIQPEIARQGQTLMQGLKNEGILRPPQQIFKSVSDAINQSIENSLVLQKADPVATKYMSVLKKAIVQSDGTLAGELKVRQLMDQAYKNSRGKLAFGSDKISALDEIHSAARDALNQDIISKARSVDVQSALKSQWDLFRASDVLRAKAESEAGTSIERFMQKHPTASALAKTAARAAGVGAGIHLLP